MAHERNFKIDQSKNTISRKFIRAKNINFQEIYHLQFQWYKSMRNKLTRINKLKYYKTFFSKHKTNSRETRETMRSLINVKIKSYKWVTYLNINSPIETNLKTICISYHTVPSTIWPIFSEFLIFCWLISRAFKRVKWKQNIRNGENIGDIVRDKRAITSLSLSWKMFALCYCNSTCIKGKKCNNKFLSSSNHLILFLSTS